MNYPEAFVPVLIVQHTGQRFPLGQRAVTIGSAGDNRVVLADPQVSPHHAAITWQGGTYVLQDLGSEDGTYVNEWRITGPQPLYDGDVIRVGDTHLEAQLAPAAPGAGVPPTIAFPTHAESPTPAPDAPPARTYRAPAAPVTPVPATYGRPYRTPPRRSSLPMIIGLLLLGLILAGLVIGGLFLLLGGGQARPVVTIQSPSDEQQIVAGEEIQIQATATGVRDITRLELSIDGVLVGTAGSDNPAGQPSITASQPWTFQQPGAHVITVTAYTARDSAGTSESAEVLVVSSAAELTPAMELSPTTEPTATPTESPTETPALTDTPAPTDTPEPSPTPAGPVVEFSADDTTISAGETTFLRWHVENVQEIYLEDTPVTGPDGVAEVSPTETTTYRLRVVYSGGEDTYEVTITVEPAPEGSVTLTSEAALDGIVASDGGTAADIDISAGNGEIGGDPPFEPVLRGFLSFNLSEMPAGATIQSAELRFYQAQVRGDPYGKLDTLQLTHVDYGNRLDSGDFDTPSLGSVLLEPQASPGVWYVLSSADLVTWIQEDLALGRGRTQFRIQFVPETDGDGEVDLALFEPAENFYGTGNVPHLIVTYTP